MKRVLASLALAALSLPAWSATSVGVSIGIDQPGFYGRVDIGSVSAPPVLVYPRPVVILPTPVVQYQSPIYLHVPPGHAKHWKKHCGYYGACNRPVYFVQEDWYRKNVRHVHQAHNDKHSKHKHRGKGRDD